ncbi:MAG: penicillin-binding transpeptidase domain-containing protein [Verrucomicrobia bacterium]|nr:penicillin-binding transpeptidase domain-containing protein [Verrucomicrobiota bacterium]
MSKGFASNYRIVLLSGGLLLCFGAIGARLVWLHVVYPDQLVETKADARSQVAGQPRLQPRHELIAETRRQLIVDKARRGDIFDARGALLATSRSVLQLGIDPNPVSEKEEKLIQDRNQKDPKARKKYEDERLKQEREGWPKLAALIGLPEEELRRIRTTLYREPAPAKASSGTATPTPAAAPRAAGLFNPPAAPVAAEAEPTAVATDLTEEDGDTPAGPVFTLGKTAATEEDADNDSEPVADGRRKIRWAVLLPEISETKYDEVKKLCAEYKIKNVYATSSYHRVYPHNQLGSHLLGYVDRAEKPVTGLERFADFYLRGQDGWREGERDVRGRELPQFNRRAVERVDGYSVTLSLQTKVQNIVERELQAIAAQYRPLKATIVVSDPRTGFILALGNYPTFNPNEYNKVPADQLARLKNIAAADVYEPGSVFKIVAASGALEDGLVTPDTRFDCSITKIDYLGRTRGLPGEDLALARSPGSPAVARSRASWRGPPVGMPRPSPACRWARASPSPCSRCTRR